MEKVFNKLVRDNIPNIIEKNGEKSFIKILDDNEYSKELLKKLEEETKEVINSTTKEELIEELADVYEVLKSIAELNSFSINDVENVALEKKLKKGGFSKKIFLKKTCDTNK